MDPTASVSLPFPFYLCILAVLSLAWTAWQRRDEGWGIPMLAVVGTAGVWYIGDVLYNDYGSYQKQFGEEPLIAAWWEVLLFFLALGILTPIMNRKINGDLVNEGSRILWMMQHDAIDQEQFQDQISAIGRLLLWPWIILMALGLFRTKFDVIGMFFPYLGEKADPWARDRIGSGIDAIYAFAIYIQLMLTALWGVVFALSKRSSTFATAGIIYFLSAPFYVFDRTRSYMLAILLPGFMALITLRIKKGIWMRLLICFVGFMTLEHWMKFVIDNRDKGSIAASFKTGGTRDLQVKAKKHGGFNMYQELCYINYFIANDTYKVNWGSRYFAEIVNPIPRIIWPGKPMIGIDYAIARGMAYGTLDSKSGGVAASISTGMIGQGVVNFGGFLGPIASAFLMAVWIAVLARQDLMGNDLGHLLLYAIGLVLTYNMGRDITLLILYPFVFGLILLNFVNKRKTETALSAS